MGEGPVDTALARENVLPQPLWAGAESVTKLRVHDEPGASGDFGLELPSRPACVASEQPNFSETQLIGGVAEVEHAELARDLLPAFDLRTRTTATQTYHGIRLDWPSDENYWGMGCEAVPVLQRYGHRNFARPVENDTERSVDTVMEEQHDATSEVGVDQWRSRHDEPTCERRLDHAVPDAVRLIPGRPDPRSAIRMEQTGYRSETGAEVELVPDGHLNHQARLPRRDPAIVMSLTSGSLEIENDTPPIRRALAAR